MYKTRCGEWFFNKFDIIGIMPSTEMFWHWVVIKVENKKTREINPDLNVQ